MSIFYEDFSNGLPSLFTFDAAGFSINTTDVPEGFTNALQSRTITDSQNCYCTFSLNLVNAAKINFWYKVSSESGYDYFNYYIDDEKIFEVSGDGTWKKKYGKALAAGEHTFKFEYDKDSSGLEGTDNFMITGIEAIESIFTPLLGSGTVEDPYLVSDSSNLESVAMHLSSYFKQTADIDLGGIENWSPIGVVDDEFTGNYDGQEFIIKNLKINDDTAGNAGLFGRTETATLKNIRLINVNIIAGGEYVGPLSGDINGGIIDNCIATGNITFRGLGSCGGLVGECWTVGGADKSATITNSFAFVDINIVALDLESNCSSIGGFVGNAGSYYSPGPITDINNCAAYGNITSPGMYEDFSIFEIGGFIGHVGAATKTITISKCFAMGNVMGDYKVGGFVGKMGKMGKIVDCYSTGSVNGIPSSIPNYGTDAMGGFVGQEYGFASAGYGQNTIQRCFSTGTVCAGLDLANCSNTGGFVGHYIPLDSTIIIDSYYDSDLAGQTDVIATAKTTVEMKNAATFASWDLVNTWNIDPLLNGAYLFIRSTDGDGMLGIEEPVLPTDPDPDPDPDPEEVILYGKNSRGGFKRITSGNAFRII